MTVRECALTFPCGGEQLVGVLAMPETPDDIGVIVVVGGPQYRGGSHRQFVLLARRLATAGITVLRFDCRGMGDSTGAMRSFEDTVEDVGAAIDAMRARCPQVERVVLWGLCDAASSALLYCRATGDPRVAGLVLLNPWVRSTASHAKTQLKYYYLRRLADRTFWSKLGKGRVDVVGAARAVARGVATVATGGGKEADGDALPFQARMAEALRAFAGPVLVVLSGHDLTAREFVEYASGDAHWSGLLDRGNVTRLELAEADHTFSTARWRDRVETCTLDWLRRTVAAARS